MLNRVKQYIKHSRTLRMLLFFPLWFRRKLYKSRTKWLRDNYSKVVLGGHLIIDPANFPGHFEIDATSDLAKRVLRDGSFEPELTAFLERFADIDGDIVNVGANVGFYAMFFAQKFRNSRRIIAIEPNPEAIELLRRNIVLNGLEDRITVLEACIGAVPGEAQFAFVPGKPEYSSIGGISHAAVKGLVQEHVSIEVLPLTSVVTDQSFRPGLMFIDTEGAELQVLKGAEDILRDSLPVLFFECEDDLLRKFDHSSQMLETYVAGLGYEVRNALAPTSRLKHPFSGVAVAIPAGSGTWQRVLKG